MASARNENRPLSPHLQVWKWGPHMLVSILHRVTGTGMATVGVIVLLWWLAALAGGEKTYADFMDLLTYASGAPNIAGYILGIGLTLSFFQHMMSGIRHFVMDAGASFELQANKSFAILTIVISVLLTAVLWGYLSYGQLTAKPVENAPIAVETK
ncbi:succinate dehydrogenase, cytochrome b556 subunit [Sphingomonas sp. BT-65]|uniref:succinate dehydrogenase, cytochrome b556 subunit n=1 Tax=Sphingomonas sp. BT-65 TaxID=2989821 RepID=UPI00223664B9|nr:succinate dehydrogenase, cytochrome b556 subunit [Sphingomonas sp. BT-65]MCW4461593.1 succinate dehydrogenase, cytochrome b556 subunit [Sphingomonas sp. BT-65]